jgi:hypothetical protein
MSELFSSPLHSVRLSEPPSLLVGEKEAQIMIRSSAVGMVTKLRAGRSGVRNLETARSFPFHQNHQEQLWISRRLLFNGLSFGDCSNPLHLVSSYTCYHHQPPTPQQQQLYFTLITPFLPFIHPIAPSSTFFLSSTFSSLLYLLIIPAYAASCGSL